MDGICYFENLSFCNRPLFLRIPEKNNGFENAHPWLFKFPQKMGFEKSQILGAGLGPAQKRQKRQPCHFCHVIPGPDLTHTRTLLAGSVSLVDLLEGLCAQRRVWNVLAS